MKINLVLLFSLFCCGSFGYDLEHISISDYEFRRYVRPQLRSISNEFQTLFFALNPELETFKSAYGNFKELNSVRHRLKSDCSILSQACREDVKKTQNLLSKILEELEKDFSLAENNPDKTIAFHHSKEMLVQQVFQALLKSQHLLYRAALLPKDGPNAERFAQTLAKIHDAFSAFLFQNSDPRFQNEFNSFWIHFIRPVEGHVLRDHSLFFFKTNLTELNMRWNMLNVRLTKRSFTPSKQVSTLLNIMHRRWNNVLKISLKPKG